MSMRIPGLRNLSPLLVLEKTVKNFGRDDMPTYAAALAYQVFFSIFPFIIFLVALLSFIGHAEFFEWLRMQAAYLLPDSAMKMVNQVIGELKQPKGGLLSIGVIVAIWTASSAIRALMDALNAAYDVAESRPSWKLYPLSILYTLGIAALLIGAAVLMAVGPEAMNWLAGHIGFQHVFVTLWAWLRWPLTLLLLTLSVALVYYVCPDVEQEFRFITPGAVLSVIAWILATIAFKLYVSNFSNYDATYGSIGTIIILLFYFYISAAVLLFGAEVNAVIEFLSPAGKDPGEKRIPSSPDDHSKHARRHRRHGGLGGDQMSHQH